MRYAHFAPDHFAKAALLNPLNQVGSFLDSNFQLVNVEGSLATVL